MTVDASPVGLGAVLRQQNPANPSERHIVALASRALTDVERRYSQIEKEALAIVWACERLQLYLLGRKFQLETDNKALQLILANPSAYPPARLRRSALRLAPFEFDVIHRPGLGNVADYLSRHPAEPANNQTHDALGLEAHVNAVIALTAPVALTPERIASETQTDSQLQALQQCISKGRISDDQSLAAYRPVFSELSIAENGIVLRGERIVPPSSLWSTCVELAHEGHQGIVKTKRLLRSKLWFPGIDRLVEQRVADCLAYQANSRDETRPVPTMTELPPEPWHTVATDYFGPHDGVYIMVVYDLYSRYATATEIKSTQASAVKAGQSAIFMVLGVPYTVVSDNGPPFSSLEYAEFAAHLGFRHRKVTPYWPQANGAAESFMKGVAKAIRSAYITGRPWREELVKYLAAYRSTPHAATGVAPATLMFGRANTSRLPRDCFKKSELNETE